MDDNGIVCEAVEPTPSESVPCRNLILELISGVLSLHETAIDMKLKFTGLGGNSLLAVQLAQMCDDVGVKLSVESILASESIEDLITQAQYISPPWSILSDDDPSSSGSFVKEILPTESMRDVDEVRTSLTEIQQVLIHGTQRHPSRNIIRYYETHPTEHVPLLRHAWQTVVSMEPIFRTKIELQDGYHMVEKAEAPFFWTETTFDSQQDYENALQGSATAHPRDFVAELDDILESRFEVINLDQGACHERVSTIIWSIHHALIDGYSASLILEKVRRVASGLSVQPGPSFTTLAERLQDLQVKCREAGEAFWREQSARYGHAIGDLQLAAPSSAEEGIESFSFTMPTEVPSLARSIGVTTATVSYVAWAMALSLFTDSDTVVFGVVLSGRNLPLANTATTIGPLVNTLPLHIELNPSQMVDELLQSTFKKLVNLSSFQWTLPEHGYNRKFASAVSMQLPFPTTPETDIMQPLHPPHSHSETDFPISIFVEANGTVRVQYDKSMYQSQDVELLIRHYERAFTLLLNPAVTVERCLHNLLTPDALSSLLVLGNCHSPRTSFGHIPETLVTLFQKSAAEHGDDIAVQKTDRSLTYTQLLRAASRVAHRLAPLIKEGDVVCLHADQSIEWIIGIYGILLAGGIYCALDSRLPQNLRNHYAETANAAIFLVPLSSQSNLIPASSSTVLSVEECVDCDVAQDIYHSTFPTINLPGNAYLCFTSGSTGKPKGVMCTHAGLVAFQRDFTVRLMARPGWRIAQTMSPAFDGSIHEIFSALSYGSTLVLPRSADPFAHLSDADACILTPSVAKVLDPERFPSLQTVYLVGEPVSQEVNDRWTQAKAVYNMYGPTEGTGGATIKRLLPNQPVTIGRPNPSTRIYILSQKQSLVPPGTFGEIWLAGVQVAQGYIGLPEATEERFRPDIVCPDRKEMMYRTGDYGYWDVASGEVVCLGRKDRQIKLRGFRLDLNDLEIRMLALHPSVTAVAISRKDDSLVAMVTPASVDAGLLADLARQALPIHALPRKIIPVDHFPVTPAGKLDYKAIANLASDRCLPVIPAPNLLSATERRLARTWRLVLGLDSNHIITRLSRFFDLGGHSLQQLHLASRLNEEFQRRIPVRVVVESSTLQEMADRIDLLLTKEGGTSMQISGPVHQVEDHEVAPIEMEWWRKYQLGEATSAFNVCFVGRFDAERLDRRRLTASWNKVLGRHPILRSRYLPDRKAGVRRLFATSPPQVHRVTHLDLWKEVNRPFVLAHQDPIRVLLSDDTLLVVVSHIICDLNTLELLHEQVIGLYRGDIIVPPAPTSSYMQVMMHNSTSASCDLDFWLEYLAQAPVPGHDSFAVATERLDYRGSSVLCRVPDAVGHRLLQVGRESCLSLHQLALTAVALTMHAAKPEPLDIVIGGPHLNRKTQDARKSIGLFLEPLPIRIRERTSPPLLHTRDFLHSVRCASQDALGHAVPWNQLLRHLAVVPDYPNHPLFDVMVTFHDHRTKHPFALPGFERDHVGVWSQGSKFKLLFEFLIETGDRMQLRVEHDVDCYPDLVIQRMVRVLRRSLELLGTETSYPELRAQLAQEVERK
ncbi:Nonribosomal peptide synthetase 10 [Penicillium rolfsii]|nr:Nonribosomal peptide synthetase 10 [Penicillium rolfsii]